MPDFQRARSAEQREMRREAILAVAAEMLDEMPVAGVTMNELSRRVGLAKSNVMRYFESREAVLLDLLTRLAERWLVAVSARVQREVPRDGDLSARSRGLASALAREFGEHVVLCDLLSAQASVLEPNVSDEVALNYKRRTQQTIGALADLVAGVLPELDAERARDAAVTTIVLVGALWTLSHPSPAVAAAYRTDPSLAVAPEFAHVLGTYLAGLLAA